MKGEGLIFGVDAAARRYSELGADVEIGITGDGEFDVRQCLGQYQSSLTKDLGNVFRTADAISDSL
jgi:hypothetical protein